MFILHTSNNTAKKNDYSQMDRMYYENEWYDMPHYMSEGDYVEDNDWSLHLSLEKKPSAATSILLQNPALLRVKNHEGNLPIHLLLKQMQISNLQEKKLLKEILKRMIDMHLDAKSGFFSSQKKNNHERTGGIENSPLLTKEKFANNLLGLNTVSNENLTPLDYALKTEDTEVITLLKNAGAEKSKLAYKNSLFGSSTTQLPRHIN